MVLPLLASLVWCSACQKYSIHPNLSSSSHKVSLRTIPSRHSLANSYRKTQSNLSHIAGAGAPLVQNRRSSFCVMVACFESVADMPFLGMDEWLNLRNEVAYDLWCYEQEQQSLQIDALSATSDGHLMRTCTIRSIANPIPFALRPIIGYDTLTFVSQQQWHCRNNDVQHPMITQ